METKKTTTRQNRKDPVFSLGVTVKTHAVHENESADTIDYCLLRHQRGDWGDVCPDDWKRNEEALVSGARLLSVYLIGVKGKLLVITDAVGDDGLRAVTTVLYPSDY
jgi:hypothetical protein